MAPSLLLVLQSSCWRSKRESDFVLRTRGYKTSSLLGSKGSQSHRIKVGLLDPFPLSEDKGGTFRSFSSVRGKERNWICGVEETYRLRLDSINER